MRHGVHNGVAPKTCGQVSVQRQSNSRRWLHRVFPHKRHQMRHLCDLACLLAKQVLSQTELRAITCTLHPIRYLQRFPDRL
jgi:hypothetical protein